MKMVRLRSSDGEEFEVAEETIGAASVMIKGMLEDDVAVDVIPLPNVTGRILSRILDYVNRHFSDPVGVTSSCPGADDPLRRFDDSFVHVDQDTLFDLLLDTFIAGIDTSSVTILWAMSELIRKPHVLGKVQADIKAVAGGNVNGRVLSEDVSKLSYLGMVVKETMRLHLPAPLLLLRETMRHIQVAGYDVPAKTRVYVSAWAIGRDPASWPDNPKEFNPDRFEGSDIDLKGENPELTPFGTGRRICPGMSMAMATVEFTLANLLCCFEWALPEGMVAEDVSMEEEGRLVFHRKTPLVLVPTAYVPPRPRPC